MHRTIIAGWTVIAQGLSKLGRSHPDTWSYRKAKAIAERYGLSP